MSGCGAGEPIEAERGRTVLAEARGRRVAASQARPVLDLTRVGAPEYDRDGSFIVCSSKGGSASSLSFWERWFW